jgi:deoxyribodipyrimidine photo-lyase
VGRTSESVPSERLRALNDRPLQPSRDYVLYWMVALRRRADNFALQHAAARARELDKPLLVLEALRSDYPYQSERISRFVLDGMADNERDFAAGPALYYPYLEPEPGAGKGLVEALAARAAAVVTDDYPCFFIPRMQAAVAPRLDVRLEAVDGNGILPLRTAAKTYLRAFDFRRFVQRELPGQLAMQAKPDPLSGLALPVLRQLPSAIVRRWPGADRNGSAGRSRGGAAAALERAQSFVSERLPRYDEARNHPDEQASSGLSPYLHFGHIAPQRVLSLIAAAEEWGPEHLGKPRRGQREGFWQMHPSAEAFLDQLVTWRELGFNFCATRDDYASYDSLPEWAQKTLAKHEQDPRVLYSLEQLERAETGDQLWNAAQRELVETGVIHNYMRMLWGKKVLEWSPTPREAAERLVYLNDKYALDGRDPNSYSGIFWCFGRYDRAWGPERPIFGTVRTMTSDSARRKLRLREYLKRFSGARQAQLFA